MAEAYLKSLQLKDVKVISSGTIADKSRKHNEPHIAPLVTRMDVYGIGKYLKTHPEQLTQARLDKADINIFMNELVVEEAKRIVTIPENAIVWNITDSGEGRRIIKTGENPLEYTDEIFKEIMQNVNSLERGIRVAKNSKHVK